MYYSRIQHNDRSDDYPKQLGLLFQSSVTSRASFVHSLVADMELFGRFIDYTDVFTYSKF
jgi:hypothetical protein